MKHMSTTSVSKGLVTKSALVAAAVVLAVSGPINLSLNSSTAFALSDNEYRQQIEALNNEIGEYQKKASDLSAEAATYESELAVLTNQKAAIQAQIDVSQHKYDLLKQQIADTEDDIATNKDALGQTVADMYVDGSVTPLEMLASSNDIGDYVDKQEYRSSVQDNLAQTIDRIDTLRKQLKQQQTDVERVLADQENQRKALAAKEAEKQELVNKTRGDESAYRDLSASRDAQKGKLQQELQNQINARIPKTGGLYASGSLGSYASWAGNCYVDGNAVSHGGAGGNGTDPAGYGCNQCVSFAAWKMGQVTGYIPTYWGNANMWPGSASGAGFTVSSAPRGNSIGVMYVGAYGHVAYIQSVSGGMAHVQQYNYLINGQWGQYSEMDIPASAFDKYIYL